MCQTYHGISRNKSARHPHGKADFQQSYQSLITRASARGAPRSELCGCRYVGSGSTKGTEFPTQMQLGVRASDALIDFCTHDIRHRGA